MNQHTSRSRIIPRVSYTNFRKAFPNLSEDAFTRWFSVSRAWSGRIFNVSVKHHQLSFDFRKDWLADMIDGRRNQPFSVLP